MRRAGAGKTEVLIPLTRNYFSAWGQGEILGSYMQCPADRNAT